MSASKHLDKICCTILAITLGLTVVFLNMDKLGIQPVSAAAGYVSRLFNTSTVHTIDIIMDDWDTFLENCTDEQYTDCTVVIDGEAYNNAAIRAKGNTSLSSVEAYGNNRYSFKIEFDHYDDAINYYGLDKLCLNNIIQDHTYMKDYLVYQMMEQFGADSPLCSYSYLTVNGDDWGLYLAVEGVEESFLTRNYGNSYGRLYKPDSMKMGGGRGNGRDFDFDMDEFDPRSDQAGSHIQPFEKAGQSSDVSLIYTDDEFDSYSNIFDNAKTDVSDADKTRLIASLQKLNNRENLENIVDIDEVIRYFVVHNFVLNFDSYTGSMIHNYYLYEKDGQFRMIPWDYNLAFGGFESQTDAAELINYPIDTPVSGGTVDSRPMLAWIFENAEYTELYHQYFREFLHEYFNNGTFENTIDSVKEMIAPYVEKDPTKFCTYEEFEQGVSTLKDFCTLRAKSIKGQLDGTIPSTKEEQTQNNSLLTDASELAISDMGGMELMGGPHLQGHAPDNMEIPKDIPERMDAPDHIPEQMDAPEYIPESGNKPDQISKPMNMPGHVPDNMDTTNRKTSCFLMLAVSAAVLLIGILTALLFRRRRRITVSR